MIGIFDTSVQEGVDPRSFDNGLGSEPLQTIKELKFSSHMLKNSWQTVLGYVNLGKRDPFMENCLRDLALALDGATDEQFLQCRKFLLAEIKSLASRGFGPSRRGVRKAVLRHTLEQASRAWPRIARLLQQRSSEVDR